MADYNTIDPGGPFSPSELVVLRGTDFARKKLFGNTRLLTGEKVALKELAATAVMAAFLASEQTGAIRLEEGTYKKLLRGKGTTIYAVTGDKQVSWPEHSLESEIVPIIQRMNSGEDKSRGIVILGGEWGDPDAGDILYSWLKTDFNNPWKGTVAKIMDGLAQRGLLAKGDKTVLGVVAWASYSLPEETRIHAAQVNPLPVQGLLNQCRNTRKLTWNTLQKQTRTAIQKRVYRGDGSI